MSLSHDRAPETAPLLAETSVCQAAPARPNLGVADYPIAQGGGANAAGAVLAVDPLAEFYYEALVQDPVANVRDALFTCYLHNWPGFNQMLGVVDSAARAELDATEDAGRVETLTNLRPGLAAGKAAMREEATPFELDILLGALDSATAPLTADFVTLVYEGASLRLAHQLRDHATGSGDSELLGRAHQLMSLLGVGGPSSGEVSPIEEPTDDASGWDKIVDWGVSGAGGLVDAGVDALAGTPVLGDVAAAVAPSMKFGQEFVGGFAKGAGDMVGGLATMATQPIATLKGIGAMLEHLPGSPLKSAHKLYDVAAGNRTLEESFLRNPLTAAREDLGGDRDFWKQLGGAMLEPYRASIEEGKTGEALGRGVFDVGSMFIGAGELKALGKGAKVASKLDDATLAATKVDGLGGVSDDAARVGMKPNKNPAKDAADARIPSEKRGKKAPSIGTKSGVQRLSADVEAEFHRVLGEAKTTRLLARYGADAIEHYGPEFFATLKGVTNNTMDHMLSVARVAKGKIVGCHDEATFLDALVRQGNGAVVRTTSAVDPNLVRIEYNLFQRDRTGEVIQPPTLQVRDPEVKTVLRDLSTDTAGWQARFSRMLDQAIQEKAVPVDGGSFQITARGVDWQGYLRNGVVDTLFPLLKETS